MWHVDCMFKMGCQFEMNPLLKAPVRPLPVERGQTIFDLTSFISPQCCRIGSHCELSPNFPAAAFMSHVRTLEISPHKITPPQLLHCRAELSQAVDLIRAFMCRRAAEAADHRKPQARVRETSWAAPCIQKEAGCTGRGSSPALCKRMARHNL